MARTAIKWLILVSMPALLGLYLVFNTGKLQKVAVELRQISEGTPAANWALALDGKVLISRALPTSGIFDRGAMHQINVESIPKHLYERIQSHTDHVTQVYNNKAQTSRLVDSGKYLATQIADRRVYLVQAGDTATVAAIFWQERRRARDIVICADKTLCPTIKFNLTQGWAGVDGPFLKTDISPIRRGLPRGRWLAGPVSTFRILSRQAQEISLELMLLRLSADQIVTLKGQGVLNQKLQFQGKPQVLAGGRMYPSRYRFHIELHKGSNEFKLLFSKWQSVRDPRTGLGGYAVKMKVLNDE